MHGGALCTLQLYTGQTVNLYPLKIVSGLHTEKFGRGAKPNFRKMGASRMYLGDPLFLDCQISHLVHS